MYLTIIFNCIKQIIDKVKRTKEIQIKLIKFYQTRKAQNMQNMILT